MNIIGKVKDLAFNYDRPRIAFSVVFMPGVARKTITDALVAAFGYADITDEGENHIGVDMDWDCERYQEEDLLAALEGQGFEVPALQYADEER
jgi:hypothetical protein